MQLVIDDAIRTRFELYIGLAEIADVSPGTGSIETEISAVEAALRAQYEPSALKDIRTLRLQRDFFWHMGIDPTKVRPASEALLRRILTGRGLPRISPIVDAYNLASVQTLLTFSVFDLRRIVPPLMLRFAHAGEMVRLIGDRLKSLKGKEIVLCDSEKILSVYVHGDTEQTKVTASTKDLLLVAYGIPGISKSELDRGMDIALDYITRFAGGKIVEKGIYG